MDETQADDAEAAAAVAAVQAEWADAFARRDAAGLAALYAEDAAFYGSLPALYRGRDGVREYFSLLPPRYRWARFGAPALVALGPGAVAASGPVEFGTEEDGRQEVLRYRITHVLVRSGATWLIAAHHASPVPG